MNKNVTNTNPNKVPYDAVGALKELKSYMNVLANNIQDLQASIDELNTAIASLDARVTALHG